MNNAYMIMFAILYWADAVFTIFGIEMGVFEERNPLLGFFIDQMGGCPYGILIPKVIAFAFFVLVVVFVASNDSYSHRGTLTKMLVPVCVIYAIIVSAQIYLLGVA